MSFGRVSPRRFKIQFIVFWIVGGDLKGGLGVAQSTAKHAISVSFEKSSFALLRTVQCDQIWQNVAILANSASLRAFLKAWTCSWQYLKPTLTNCYTIGQVSIVINYPILKNNLTNWSHWYRFSITKSFFPVRLHLLGLEGVAHRWGNKGGSSEITSIPNNIICTTFKESRVKWEYYFKMLYT